MPEINIHTIEKVNVQDGDIIILPVSTDPAAFKRFHEALRTTFPDKKFLVVTLSGDLRQDGKSGIRVMHLV